MLSWPIPSHLAPEGQFNSSCFSPWSQRAEYQSSGETNIRLNTFCTILLEERLVCCSLPLEGRAGNGIITRSLKGKHRGTCSSSFSEGRLAVSSKPSSPWSRLPQLALHRSISPTSFYSLAGRNLSLPKPQAWKLSSSRQLSVLKEYTDLTFLRSHRRLIS